MAGGLLHLAAAVAIAVVAWICYPFKSSAYLPPVTEGYFHPAYRPLADLFRTYVKNGYIRGGAFAVYHKGERLVDLWGGYADIESYRPWREDTLTLVYSAAKGPSAIAVAKLVDKGILDYGREIKSYWPEFDQNGKGGLTLGMLMSHQAGLNTLGNQTISLMEYKHEWRRVEKLLAEANPDFSPGSAVGYASFTPGMYIDALVRRADPTHRNLSLFFAEEIAKPFGIDFHIGLPRGLYHRAARHYFPSLWSSLLLFFDSFHRALLLDLMSSDSLLLRSGQVFDFVGKQGVLNDPQNMEVGVGSVTGFASARSLAKLYDFVANRGAIGDTRLLSERVADLLMTPVTTDLPQTIKLHLVFTLGLTQTVNSLGISVYGHPGNGGQHGAADPVHQLGIAYVTNFPDAKFAALPDHYWQLEKVFYQCFQKHRSVTHR